MKRKIVCGARNCTDLINLLGYIKVPSGTLILLTEAEHNKLLKKANKYDSIKRARTKR